MQGLELIMTIHVVTENAIVLQNDEAQSVVMIPFSGHATGPLFQGEIEKGGVDTQIINHYGKQHTLSARYIISGTDYTGNPCKIYIENNGNIGPANDQFLFRTYPRLITSSEALKGLEHEIIVAEGIAATDGVTINLYKVI